MPYPLAGITSGLSEVGRFFGAFVSVEGGGGMSVFSTRNVFFLGLGAIVGLYLCISTHPWGFQTCRNDEAA